MFYEVTGQVLLNDAPDGGHGGSGHGTHGLPLSSLSHHCQQKDDEYLPLD